jgi:hypothetical protein
LHVNWSDFSDGVKLIVIRELCREMPFYDAVSFIQLEENEIEKFIKIVEREIACQDGERERIARANDRQMKLIESGNTAQTREKWEAFMEEEIHGENSWEPALFSISRDDVERAKLFLRDFRYREEFPEYDPRTTPTNVIEEMNAIPPYLTLQNIISRLSTYEGVDVTFVNLEFERGLLDMFFEAKQFMEGYNHRANLGELDNPEDMPGTEYKDFNNLDSVLSQEQAQPNKLNRFRTKEHGQPYNLDSVRPRQYKRTRKSVAFESDEYEEPEDFAEDDDAAFEPEPKKKKKASIKCTMKKDKEVKKKDKEVTKKDKEVMKKDKEVMKKDKEVMKKGKEVTKKDKEVTKKDKEVTKKDNKEAVGSRLKKPTKHNPKPKPKATLPPSRLREVTNAQEDETPEPSRTSALFPPAASENSIHFGVPVDGSATGKGTLKQLSGPAYRAVQPRSKARERSTAREAPITTSDKRSSKNSSPSDVFANIIESETTTPGEIGYPADEAKSEAVKKPHAPVSTSMKTTREVHEQVSGSATADLNNRLESDKSAATDAIDSSASSTSVTQPANKVDIKDAEKSSDEAKAVAKLDLSKATEVGENEKVPAQLENSEVAKEGDSAKVATADHVHSTKFKVTGDESNTSTESQPDLPTGKKAALIAKGDTQEGSGSEKGSTVSPSKKRPFVEVPNCGPDVPATKKQRVTK